MQNPAIWQTPTYYLAISLEPHSGGRSLQSDLSNRAALATNKQQQEEDQEFKGNQQRSCNLFFFYIYFILF